MKKDGQLPAAYSKQLRRKFGLWPSWLPGSAVRIGDFGRVRNGVFERSGHLESHAVEIAPTEPRSFGDLLFASQGTRQVIAGGSAAAMPTPGAASARIEFTESFGVFVGLRHCAETRLANPQATAGALSLLREAGSWPDGTCLVTGVVDAAAALIAVGSAKGGSLELSGSGPTPDLLGWLGADLRIVSEDSLGFRALLPEGCSPLFRLAKLAGAEELVPRGPAGFAPQLLELDARA